MPKTTVKKKQNKKTKVRSSPTQSNKRTTTVKNKQIEDDLITFIIIADSPLYRMKSYGPVSLIQIDQEKLIDYQIKSIKKSHKNYEIILCLGFESFKVAKYIRSKYKSTNIRIVENQTYTHTNSCESLRIALNNTCNDKIFVIDGNLYFSYKTLKLKNHTENCVYIDKESKNFEIGINLNEKHQVEFFSFGAKYNWTEIFFLANVAVIENLYKILCIENYKKKFVFEALNSLIGVNKVMFTTIEKNQELWKINKPKRNP
jgi:hypothetical protein